MSRPVYVCYAIEDAARVEGLAQYLQTLDLSPIYMPTLVLNQAWQNQLISLLQKSELFIYVMTDASLKSAWCYWEFYQAVHMDIPVVPVLLDEDGQVPSYIESVRRVSYKRPEDPAYTDIAADIRQPQTIVRGTIPKPKKKVPDGYPTFVAVQVPTEFVIEAAVPQFTARGEKVRVMLVVAHPEGAYLRERLEDVIAVNEAALTLPDSKPLRLYRSDKGHLLDTTICVNAEGNGLTLDTAFQKLCNNEQIELVVSMESGTGELNFALHSGQNTYEAQTYIQIDVFQNNQFINRMTVYTTFANMVSRRQPWVYLQKTCPVVLVNEPQAEARGTSARAGYSTSSPWASKYQAGGSSPISSPNPPAAPTSWQTAPSKPAVPDSWVNPPAPKQPPVRPPDDRTMIDVPDWPAAGVQPPPAWGQNQPPVAPPAWGQEPPPIAPPAYGKPPAYDDDATRIETPYSPPPQAGPYGVQPPPPQAGPYGVQPPPPAPYMGDGATRIEVPNQPPTYGTPQPPAPRQYQGDDATRIEVPNQPAASAPQPPPQAAPPPMAGAPYKPSRPSGSDVNPWAPPPPPQPEPPEPNINRAETIVEMVSPIPPAPPPLATPRPPAPQGEATLIETPAPSRVNTEAPTARGDAPQRTAFEGPVVEMALPTYRPLDEPTPPPPPVPPSEIETDRGDDDEWAPSPLPALAPLPSLAPLPNLNTYSPSALRSIDLTSEETGRSRKGRGRLVFFVVIFLLAIGGGGLAFLVTSGQLGGGSGDDDSGSDVGATTEVPTAPATELPIDPSALVTPLDVVSTDITPSLEVTPGSPVTVIALDTPPATLEGPTMSLTPATLESPTVDTNATLNALSTFAAGVTLTAQFTPPTLPNPEATLTANALTLAAQNPAPFAPTTESPTVETPTLDPTTESPTVETPTLDPNAIVTPTIETPTLDPSAIVTPTPTAETPTVVAAAPSELGTTSDNPVTENAQWTPVIQPYNGADAVLVPTGCFSEGATATNAGTQVCINTPFWMDKTEVSRELYSACISAGPCGAIPASSSVSSAPTAPANNVTLDNARQYCEWRQGRVPTSAEWEYAARGPSDWLYPWGNAFDETRTVHQAQSNVAVVMTDVESYPDGASWVGALHMSGNAREWVEPTEVINNVPVRITRGGSYADSKDLLPLFFTDTDAATVKEIGFRCVYDTLPTAESIPTATETPISTP